MACELSYILSVSGDCLSTSSGAIHVDIYGDITPSDYIITWVSPFTDVIILGESVSGYTRTDLPAGNYSFYIQDTCTPTNNQILVRALVSSGTCVSVIEHTDTVCGDNNGSLTVGMTNSNANNTFSLYDNINGFLSSASTSTSQFTFTSLSASTYYVMVSDGGGCVAKSESCIIKSSTTIDYGLYIVNDSGCSSDGMGKIFVTGLTGNPPYSYSWSNEEITDNVTGLTPGSYSVTVTDSTGCAVSKTGFISTVPDVALGSIFSSPPSCMSNDGSITIVIVGGTAPYYYSGSNGSVEISFSKTHTFTNLAAGFFSIAVTDAALCTFTTDTNLITPNGFSITSISKTNATCFNNGGSINIVLNGGSLNYVYTLENDHGDVITQTTTNSSWNFTNLLAGTYQLTIVGGDCSVTQEVVIGNEYSFEVETNITGTTCGNDNGYVEFVISGGTGPYEYDFEGQSTFVSPLTTLMYNNLASDNYAYTITDTSDGCRIKGIVYVPTSAPVDFILISENSSCGNGSISAYITAGEPTFTYQWSSNVNGQTGATVTNLSAGTYTLKVIDDTGCYKQKSITLTGTNSLSTYQVFNVCDNTFENSGILGKKGALQMLVEGYYDLISGDTNCVLNEAIFEANVIISGVSASTTFYTGTTLTEYPSDSLWANTIRNLILTYDGIGNVILNLPNNKITIKTDCESEISYDDAQVLVNMVIHYDISCVSCGTTCQVGEFCDVGPLFVTYPLPRIDTLDDVSKEPTFEELDNYDGTEEYEINIFRNNYDEYFYKLIENLEYKTYGYGDNELPNDLTSLQQYFTDPNNNTIQYKVGFNDVNFMWWRKLTDYPEWTENQIVQTYFSGVEYFNFLPPVDDISLAPTGVAGDAIIVKQPGNIGDIYTWLPSINDWVAGDPADILGVLRDERDILRVRYNQTILALVPYLYAANYLPKFQITKYKNF
jgi:hypothetical protein